jgi:nucleoside-diphosphate-sugar epimerase
MESLRALVRGADAVVHCAGAVRGATQAHFNDSNVDGVARLVQAVCEQKPTPRFLLMSSLAARQPELSIYADSKRRGEKMLAAESDKLFWTIFRPSPVYGPGDRELRPVFWWMAKGLAPILGTGNGRISLLYIEDLAEAVAHWLHGSISSGNTFELHDGHPGGYSWHEIVDTVRHLRDKAVWRVRVPVVLVKLLAAVNLIAARTLAYAPMLTPGKVRELQHPDWICDNTRLSDVTGWTPKILLAEGLRRTLEWRDT